MQHNLIRSLARGAVTVCAAAAAVAAGAGIAGAAPGPGPAPDNLCRVPGLISTITADGPGRVGVTGRADFGPLWAGITFKATGTLDWRNLRTGATGHIGGEGVNAAFFRAATGPGDVEFRVLVHVADGPGPVPWHDNWTRVCTGRYLVR